MAGPGLTLQQTGFNFENVFNALINGILIVMNETPHFPFFIGLKGALLMNLIKVTYPNSQIVPLVLFLRDLLPQSV